MKKSLSLLILALMYLSSTLSAQDIIFVTPDDRDSSQIKWLEDAGYTVTEFWPDGGISLASTATLSWLNSADLIIVGRSPGSGEFDAPDKAIWNSLKAPLILNTQWAARNSRINWFPSGSAMHADTEPDTAWAMVLEPADPIFAGVTLDGDSVDWMTVPHDYLSLPDSIQTNAEVLVRWGDGILVARFDPFVEFYDGAGESAAGYRTYFGFGNDHVPPLVNFFPLTDAAKTVYMAEIERMLALGDAPAHVVFVTDDEQDSVQIDWLKDQGYGVTIFWPENGLTAEPPATDALLNNADLIIIGRSGNSSSFTPDKLAWNAIKTPLMLVSPWVARNSRINWFPSGTAVNYATPDTAWANILVPGDDIFSGVTLDGDSLDWMVAKHSAVRVPDSVAINAEVLARSMSYDNVDEDFILVARFDPMVEFYPGSGDMPSGYRSFFGMGNDQDGVINDFPLTDNARTVYLAELERLMATPEPPAHIILTHGLDPAVSHDSVQWAWLEDQGYAVTYLPIPTMALGMDTLNLLNTADLVILGRSCPSGTFAPPARAYWNAIKSPVIQVSGWGTRNSRSNWFNSGSAVNYGEPDTAWANILMPEDDIFADVTLDGDSIDWMVARHSALSLPSDVETNADILARGVGADSNYVLVARFDPLEEFYPGSVDYGSGHYTYFGMGNDESGVINTFPLTDNARIAYLAEIERQLGLPAASLSGDADLKSLEASEGELAPEFDPDVTEYTLTVEGGATVVTLTAMAHPYASVAGDGEVAVPSSDTIVVTAQNGSDTKEYVVNVVSGAPPITEIVVVGDATPNGWNMPSTEPMTQDPDNASIFTWEGILISTAAESNLKFATYNSSDWCGQWILATALEQPVEDASGYQLYQGCPPAEEDLKWHVSTDGVYLITIDVENETIEFELITGIIDNEYSDISVYPNPATSSITMVNVENLSYVAIFNLAGERVLDMNVENVNGIAEVNISELPAGFYLIRAYDDENLIGVGKFTKQ